jgi:catechol 2,3-dioxygenase-like lactoylglutathione lyase family enzyme
MRLTKVIPQFVVPDVVATAEHYIDKLGFKLLGYFLDPPVYAMVERDAAEIHFGKGDAAPGSQLRKSGMDAYIYVDDLDAVHKDLQARGANITEGPVVRVYKMREISVEDLNGYKLVFGEDATEK